MLQGNKLRYFLISKKLQLDQSINTEVTLVDTVGGGGEG
jgi:hypothetical protein